MRGPSVLLYLFSFLLTINLINAANFQGCKLDESLCESDELCVSDGLFGQCYAVEAADSIPPLILDDDLTQQQKALLRLELERLADSELDWPNARSQCVLAYYKISVAFDLNYDTEFCSVRNPLSILTLIQKIQLFLSKNSEEAAIAAEIDEQEEPEVRLLDDPLESAEIDVVIPESEGAVQDAIVVDEETGEAVPVFLVDEGLIEEAAQLAGDGEPVVLVDGSEADAREFEDLLRNAVEELEAADELQQIADLTEQSMIEPTGAPAPAEQREPKDKRNDENPKLTKTEDESLQKYVTDILNNHESSVRELSTPQLEKLIKFIGSLEESLENTEVKFPERPSAPELEEIIPLTSETNEQQLLLKKDVEKFNNADMGLANIEHKIVKGDIQRVEGNRVYLKIGKENVTEEELYKLISFLDKKIAEPNSLYFSEFQFDDGQLSFHVAKIEEEEEEAEGTESKIVPKKGAAATPLDSASGIAKAVYKRRKDIQTLAGVPVDETGIGSGADVVPVERAEHDRLFLPILMVCAFTITSLVVVLAVHVYRNRRRSFRANLPDIFDHMNGKASYEELCRQRMSSSEVPTAVTVNKSGSWPDDSLLQACNLDISTGHVILSFLQEYLDSPEKIADQWYSVAEYANPNAETTIAQRPENGAKNADPTVLPYDETLVTLSDGAYINASKIHDSDLRQVAYIAAQSPLDSTVMDFWRCIWEEGITLLVNLCGPAESYARYWPDEGAKTFGIFEIHLVSEHIWSEDYMVRSFYLKNTETNETRTVTQFHYLAWSEDGTPASIKSLLEFRRKVNKSYRGRASPVLVHCRTGTGRTGAYCLMDIVINRITKGIKELNIAGSLEHLRDQRMRMVANLDQYKLVFSCVAEEVNALLKNLQQ